MRIALIACHIESCHNACTNKRLGLGQAQNCASGADLSCKCFFLTFSICCLQDLFSVSAYVYAQKPQLDIHSFEGNFTRVRETAVNEGIFTRLRFSMLRDVTASI